MMMATRLVKKLSPKLRFCVTKCHARQFVNMKQQIRSHVSNPSGGISPQIRQLQTSIEPRISSEKIAGYELGIDGDCLRIRKGREQLAFDYTWLRDHCRCSDCYRSSAWSRLIDSADFDSNLSPDHVTISDDNNTLHITWSDGHTTSYTMEWLEDIHRRSEYPREEDTSRVFWDRETLEASLPPDVGFNDYMESEKGVTELLGNIHKFGIAFMSDVPITANVTRLIGERVHKPLKASVHGETLNFVTFGEKYKGDIGFEHGFLGLHADYSCNYDPTGYEFLHFLKQSKIGGESIFSDSLRAARVLQESHPEHYEALATLPVTFHKKRREGISVRSTSTIFDVREPNKDPVIIRPSNEDRAILQLNVTDSKRWYAAWRQFRKILTDPSSVYVIKGMPGRAIFIDNWRLSHGRLAYEGQRELETFSWSRDLVENKMRVLGVIEESPI